MTNIKCATRIICVGFAVLAVTGFGHSASATPVTYGFAATAAGGPLAGAVFAGVLTVDSASIASGSGVASDVSINVLGTVITGSQSLFGLIPVAFFTVTGTLNGLSNFVVAGNERAAAFGFSGGITLPSTISSIGFDYNFNYGTDPTQGETFKGGAVTSRALAFVPEPAAVLITTVALGALGLVRRRPALRVTRAA